LLEKQGFLERPNHPKTGNPHITRRKGPNIKVEKKEKKGVNLFLGEKLFESTGEKRG